MENMVGEKYTLGLSQKPGIQKERLLTMNLPSDKIPCTKRLRSLFSESSPTLSWQQGRRQHGRYTTGTLRKRTIPTVQGVLSLSIRGHSQNLHNFPDFRPPPPFVTITITQPFSNIVRFQANSPSPLSANVICECTLTHSFSAVFFGTDRTYLIVI